MCAARAHQPADGGPDVLKAHPDAAAPLSAHRHRHPHAHPHEVHSAERAPVPEGAPARWDDLLHSYGLRATPARQLVLDALAELGHGTPEELHARVESRLVGLSLSTVYRSLETLAEHGVVGHTHLGGSGKTYQLVSHGDHAHLVCRGCGSVMEVVDRLAAALFAGLRSEHGFEPDPGHLSVFGTCRECASAG